MPEQIIENGIQGRVVPCIKAIGVGGGGGNAINRMMAADIQAESSASFIVANTDAQALYMSTAPVKIQLGKQITQGLGAGSDPEIGKRAAEESTAEIKQCLEGTDLLFIAAGMGGGTGTGAAPVIAKLAKDMGILTVAVVTKPFETFEGKCRKENAEKGIEALRNVVDTLLVVPNDRIMQYVPKGTTIRRAFQLADEVLMQGVIGITSIMLKESVINLDFADIKTTMKNRGNAHIGIGKAKGENRTIIAVQQAVNSPLLETNIQGATNVIVYVSGSENMTLDEVNDAVSLIQQVLDPSANVIFGMGYDRELVDEIMVTVIATGFENNPTINNNASTRNRDNRLLNIYGYNDVAEAKQGMGFFTSTDAGQQPDQYRPLDPHAILFTPNSQPAQYGSANPQPTAPTQPYNPMGGNFIPNPVYGNSSNGGSDNDIPPYLKMLHNGR